MPSPLKPTAHYTLPRRFHLHVQGFVMKRLSVFTLIGKYQAERFCCERQLTRSEPRIVRHLPPTNSSAIDSLASTAFLDIIAGSSTHR